MPNDNSREEVRLWASTAGRRLQAQVLEEEGGVCHLCGLPGATTVDHLKSKREFPELVLERENMRAAHASCNSRKGLKQIVHVTWIDSEFKAGGS